jgi:hypothetical protein
LGYDFGQMESFDLQDAEIIVDEAGASSYN